MRWTLVLVVRDSERLVVEDGMYTASVHAKPNGIDIIWQSLSESTLANCHRIDILTATSRLLDNERAEVASKTDSHRSPHGRGLAPPCGCDHPG